MKLSEIKVGDSYSYNEIIEMTIVEKASVDEHGNEDRIGEHFIVVDTNDNIRMSFIYQYWNQTYGGFYKLIYKV